jgi:hypothetical protein
MRNELTSNEHRNGVVFPLRIGMIGLDTSHCSVFAELLHDMNNPYHVPGARITEVYPGGSEAFSLSKNRVNQYTSEMQDKYGVKILDSIETVAEQVDAILLESVDGRQHLEQFELIAPFGKPVFIDKPFATRVSDAKRIIELSQEYNVPIYSSSSIRYAAGISELGKNQNVLGCTAFGPNDILDDFPGLFWYGIHSAEVLFSKMGTGCREVIVHSSEKVDHIVGLWDNGRTGTIYGYRFKGVYDFGCTVYTEQGVLSDIVHAEPPAYALMLKEVVKFFNTRVSPIDLSETLEIVAFLEAANESRRTGKAVIVRGG